MNYCLYFNNNLIPLLQGDNSIEIKIRYADQFAALERFVRLYPKHRIILEVCHFQEFFNEIHFTNFKNWYLQNNPNIIVTFNPVNISKGCVFTETFARHIDPVPFYFNDIITSEKVLETYLQSGAKEVIIGGDLGFNLFSVKRKCEERGIRVRVIANLALHGETEDRTTRSFTKFFIRPEEIEFYQDYVDSIEFYCPQSSQEKLYNFYSKGKYVGDLVYLIHGLVESIPNRALPYQWTVMRAICNRKCQFGKKCKLCDSFIKVAKEKNISRKELKRRWQLEQKAKRK